MKYGREGITRFIDDEGSTEKVEKKWAGGVLAKPIRHTFEIRHRIGLEESAIISETSKLMTEMLKDSVRHDISIRIENTERGNKDGYVHLIECYTTLEY